MCTEIYIALFNIEWNAKEKDNRNERMQGYKPMNKHIELIELIHNSNETILRKTANK